MILEYWFLVFSLVIVPFLNVLHQYVELDTENRNKVKRVSKRYKKPLFYLFHADVEHDQRVDQKGESRRQTRQFCIFARSVGLYNKVFSYESLLMT